MSPLHFDDVVARVGAGVEPPLIGIDGWPVSGKSTLADRLRDQLGYACIYLDDFVLPAARWPSRTRPAFPFEYMRYAEFLAAIRSVAATGTCRYRPFDWSTGDIAAGEREVTMERSVVVEGVSALNPDVAHLYGLGIFVDSDTSTTLDAALARGAGAWEREWRDLFLPSVELYMTTDPRSRADLIAAGRGATADPRE
jgi:uridine kinase